MYGGKHAMGQVKHSLSAIPHILRLVCVLLGLVIASTCWAQESQYPDVWSRKIPEPPKNETYRIGFLAVDQAYARNPADAPEVFIGIEKIKKDTVRPYGYFVQGFFSGKRSQVKDILKDQDGYPAEVHLEDGTALAVVNINYPPYIGSSRKEFDYGSDAETDGPKPIPPQKYLFQLISAFGIDMDSGQPINWQHPTVNRSWAKDQPLSNCVPRFLGLQVYDTQGTRLWQNVIVTHGGPVYESDGPSGRSGADPYRDNCWAPGQHRMYGLDEGFLMAPLLGDGTFFVVLHEEWGRGRDEVLRLRVKDGFPSVTPDHISIIRYEDVMRLMYAADGPHGTPSMLPYQGVSSISRLGSREQAISINQYFAIQDFFFPELAGERKFVSPSQSPANSNNRLRKRNHAN